MSFRAVIFILLLSSAQGLQPEQVDIAMRDREIAMSEHNAAVENAPENIMELQRELWDLYCRCRLAPESEMSPLHQRLSAVAEPVSLYMLAVFFAECMPQAPKLLPEDMELTDVVRQVFSCVGLQGGSVTLGLCRGCIYLPGSTCNALCAIIPAIMLWRAAMLLSCRIKRPR